MTSSEAANRLSNAEVVFVNSVIEALNQGIARDSDIIGRIALSCGILDGKQLMEREDIKEAIDRGEILHKEVPAVGLIVTTDNLGVSIEQAQYIEYQMSQAVLQAAASGINISSDHDEVRRRMMDARLRARKELGLE
jgi:hypothetical protein